MAALFSCLVWRCGRPSVVALVLYEDGLFAYCSLLVSLGVVTGHFYVCVQLCGG